VPVEIQVNGSDPAEAVREEAPRKATPRKATPRKQTLRKATPRKQTPRNETPQPTALATPAAPLGAALPPGAALAPGTALAAAAPLAPGAIVTPAPVLVPEPEPEPEPEPQLQLDFEPEPVFAAALVGAKTSIDPAPTVQMPALDQASLTIAESLPAPAVPPITPLPTPHPMLVGELETGGAGVIRRVFSFIALIVMAVFIGATIAGAVAGIALLITLAAQHALG
jgi:hypothetical protein